MKKKKSFRLIIEINGDPYVVIFPKSVDERIRIRKSDGTTTYSLARRPNGDFSCNCPAQVECKHIKVLRKIVRLFSQGSLDEELEGSKLNIERT